MLTETNLCHFSRHRECLASDRHEVIVASKVHDPRGQVQVRAQVEVDSSREPMVEPDSGFA